MRLILSSNTRSASDPEIRIDWRRCTGSQGQDEVYVLVDGMERTPAELMRLGARVADASPLERRLLRHGGYASLLAQ